VNPNSAAPNTICGVLLGTGPANSSIMQAPVDVAPLTFGVPTRVSTVIGVVVKREVMLSYSAGHVGVVTASDKVTHLERVNIGDRVVVQYYVGIAAELREPTGSERATPFVIREPVEPASEEAAPGVSGARLVHVVTTVVALDPLSRMIILRDPRNFDLRIRVMEPALLETARVGDSAILVCAEAIALSIQTTSASS
jgi:hypothetical protein